MADPPPSTRLRFDVASALSQGRRDTQEDAIVADVPATADVGLVVLSDGMGGHNAGDVASRIVVSEVFGALKGNAERLGANPAGVTGILRDAADRANRRIGQHTAAHPATAGMGATLIGLVQRADTLSWISIGDSVLYLFRKGTLYQLNQDHSLAPQIDYLAAQGLLSEEVARSHPDRNCLTSALLGDEIPYIDCPDTPLQLRPGDMIVAASDGLPFLDKSQIETVLAHYATGDAKTIVAALLRSLDRLNDPEQDNVCVAVLCARAGTPVPDQARDPGGLFQRLRDFGSGWLK